VDGGQVDTDGLPRNQLIDSATAAGSDADHKNANQVVMKTLCTLHGPRSFN
jgi:hypothetical protein